MECPVCKCQLPPLEALLAQTRLGTQCPKCWARLRNLSEPPLAFPQKEKERKAGPRRRAA
jgi:hypothetical protein